MQNSNNKNNLIISFGVITILLGISILTSNYFNEKVDNAYSYMNNLLFEANLNNQEEEEIIEIQEEVVNLENSTSSFQENNKKEDKKEYVDPYQEYYIGFLEIPKINLKKGFTAIDSIHNTVSKNVEVVKGSDYPDVLNGNLILAAHSGNSYLAYFKDLYKLNLDDIAIVNYNSKKYTYKIVKIYEQAKTGQIVIYRDSNKNCLTLITCTKDSKTKQTVYILELVNVE